jgi:rare lipoprotein A
MLVRLSAAICGATILFVCSSITMARSETRIVHSFAVDRAAHGSTVVGAASMYNPYRPGYREDGTSTATGDRYNPSAWAAAIQTDLREKFGGVRHGSRVSYALVEGTNKKAIVKINDVGPLTPMWRPLMAPKFRLRYCSLMIPSIDLKCGGPIEPTAAIFI